MSILRVHSLTFPLTAVLFAASSLAQMTPPTQSGCPGTPCEVGGAESSSATAQGVTDSRGNFGIHSGAPGKVLIGVTVAGGMDSNPSSLQDGKASRLYIISPFAGFRGATPKSTMLVQYQLKYLGLNSSYVGQTLHQGSASLTRSLSDRWSLETAATASHGQNSVRLVASPTPYSSALGGTAPESTSYLTNDTTVTNISGTASVNYRASERNDVRLQVANGFTKFAQPVQTNESTLGPVGSNAIVLASLGIARRYSKQFSGTVFWQESYYYGSLACGSHGGGVGIAWMPNGGTSIAASIGPQLNNAACGARQGFFYSAAVTRTLTPRSQAYAIAERRAATSYVGPGLWQNTYRAGYSHQIASKGDLRFDVAYVRNANSTSENSYSGLFLDSTYTHPVGHGLTAAFIYQVYVDHYGPATVGRNLAMFAISWSPMQPLPIRW
jgi:hypothetical protein